MTVERGDVVLVNFPNSDLTTYKARPALVVQDTNLETGLSQVVLTLITSNLERTGPTRVPVTATSRQGKAMGLMSDSVVVTDALQTVRLKAIGRKLGTCPIMAEIELALRATLGLK